MRHSRYQVLAIATVIGSTTILVGCISSAKHSSETYCQDEIRTSVESRSNIRLLSLNMAHGRRRAFNQMFVSSEKREQNLLDIASQIQHSSADIVALQEADAPSRWSGNFNHVEYLQNATNLQCAMQGHHADTWLFTYGAALLTRSYSYGHRSIRFNPTPPTPTKGFVKATIDWSFNEQVVPVTVVSVHLDFASKIARTSQIQQMVNVLQNIDTPLIIMGDLNSYWWQTDSQVRMLSDELSLKVFNAEDQSLGTFKSESGKRLDWILISNDLDFVDYRVLPQTVSDHMAIYAEIRYHNPIELTINKIVVTHPSSNKFN